MRFATFRIERERDGRRASLAICDIDLFERYNDTYGHVAGDDALRRIAQTMKSQLRASDRLHRYGGEEFVIYLPQQREDEAMVALERVRNEVQRVGIASEGPSGTLTISVGVAELDASDRTDATIERGFGPFEPTSEMAFTCATPGGSPMTQSLRRRRRTRAVRVSLEGPHAHRTSTLRRPRIRVRDARRSDGGGRVADRVRRRSGLRTRLSPPA